MALAPQSLRLSVHGLVDFLLRTGDIDNRIFNKASMAEGTRLHQQYQQNQQGDFESEFFLTHTYEVEDYAVTIEGYADGIRQLLGKAYIEEIKTTVADLETFATDHEQWHRMQAAIYGHMYALDHGLDLIRIRLIYINQADGKTMVRSYEEATDVLGAEIEQLISAYLRFYRLIAARLAARDQSVAALRFPFTAFRPGQRELAKYVYAIAKNGGTLFAEAPTGIGKTISALYPAVLSFGKAIPGKIFYVTAKNSGHEAALQACAKLRASGALITPIALTGKDKICLTPGASCNPDECPFAKGYYDKIRALLQVALENENSFERATIITYAQQQQICPFELQLDLALFCDVIIGDYNYVFDPIVYLRRFFDGDASGHFLLVDEAHNLVERSRAMYSSTLRRASFEAMRRAVKGIAMPKFKKTITKLNKLFKESDCDDQEIEEVITLDSSWLRALEAYIVQTQDVMRKEPKLVSQALKDFYFEANRFLKLSEYFDDRFVYYKAQQHMDGFSINLLCLDTSGLLKATMGALKGRVLFSATLSPLEYYTSVLGGSTNDPVLRLPSPFPSDNLLLMVAPKVATRFTKRGATMGEVALYIELAISAKIGNYLVFFPSYKYLNDMRPYLKFGPEIDQIVQTEKMTLAEQEAFLARFVPTPEQTMVGLAVLGGAFSEGIDLIEDRLIGAVVVGVGLPQVGFERELMRAYFNKHDRDGFAFSYAYPGMNRVMQAVGRVIRSESDKGLALLMDDRYLEARYRAMFKSEWSHYEAILTPDDLQELLEKFWNKSRN